MENEMMKITIVAKASLEPTTNNDKFFLYIHSVQYILHCFSAPKIRHIIEITKSFSKKNIK